MVFYGKKRSQTDQNYEDYHSIRDEILKQLGERMTPVYEKSLATMFADAGDAILVATESILNIPDYIRSTELYAAYKMDQEEFKTEIQPNVTWYQQIPKTISQNKLFLIRNYTCQQRIFALNASVALLGIASLGFRKGLSNKMRGLMKTCLIGYSVGGIFLVPEIYNSIFSSKVV